VRQADEDSLLELAPHLPAEAAEALLELATDDWRLETMYGSKGLKFPVAVRWRRPPPYSHPAGSVRYTRRSCSYSAACSRFKSAGRSKNTSETTAKNSAGSVAP